MTVIEVVLLLCKSLDLKYCITTVTPMGSTSLYAMINDSTLFKPSLAAKMEGYSTWQIKDAKKETLYYYFPLSDQTNADISPCNLNT